MLQRAMGAEVQAAMTATTIGPQRLRIYLASKACFVPTLVAQFTGIN